jgi:hypothetical protein
MHLLSVTTRIVELINLQKYHSLAAKGETVDLSKLEEAQQAKSSVDVQQAPPSNGAVNATVKHSQTVAGATMPTTQQSAVTVPAAPVAASSAPASAAQPGAGAMPQALLNSGKQESCDRIQYGKLTILQYKTRVSRT